MTEPEKTPQLISNEQLGNCLKCYELEAIDTQTPREEVSFRYDDDRVFIGHSALQLERFGIIEQREDRCFLTEKGVDALKEIVSRPDSSLKMITGDDWEISNDYLTVKTSDNG